MSGKITAIFPFCGIGGGAIGALMARPEAFGVTGQVEVVCGMDVDPDACQNFEAFTGAPCYQFDFFSRQQYIDWHGHEPPEDWREMTPDDIWRACNYKTPDFSFRSAPCKGFTGLIVLRSNGSKPSLPARSGFFGYGGRQQGRNIIDGKPGEQDEQNRRIDFRA
jgi:site-specific DNA-cytosine methylase